MRNNPYLHLQKNAFWKNAVAHSNGPTPNGLYQTKWSIAPAESIATAGSCFAQHIGSRLKQHNFKVLDLEPAPPRLALNDRKPFGFSIYSARYGNIYTTRQLLQLAQEAFGEISQQHIVWQNASGLYVDALRPGVEPLGLTSPGEVLAHRAYHLQKVREMLETMDLMFFTMGLTEAWVHRESGTVYPTAPGTLAGHYDPELFAFKNFSFNEVLRDFLAFRKLVHARRKNTCRFVITVSPVPLAATASNKHVMLATVYSKSVLRAVAGALSDQFDDIDYFPSYEIITNPWSDVCFYDTDKRSVTSDGVNAVMSIFFAAHKNMTGTPVGDACKDNEQMDSFQDIDESLVCEEMILEAFAGAGV